MHSMFNASISSDLHRNAVRWKGDAWVFWIDDLMVPGRIFNICWFPQSPPDHVIPGPEELYVYSPLGTAFKVTGSDLSSKNPSIITM